MTAILSWLDFSARDRQRALDVVDLLRERSTVDELGLGLVRDAFADLLFPGTSTIQTRARYFLFIPWIYVELEWLRVPSIQAASRSHKAEITLIDALADSGESAGVIGIQARKTLKRLPSGVYWNGLRSWGIRLFPGSLSQYEQSLDGFYASPRRVLLDDDKNPVGGGRLANWDPSLPPAPDGFPKGASLQLAPVDAEYLRERIMLNQGRSLLAFLVERGQPSDVPLPWSHPQAGDFRDPLREWLFHARQFSEGMLGAQLLYNLMLAEASKNDDRFDSYKNSLEAWAGLVESRERVFVEWDRARFWAIAVEGRPHVSHRARAFIDAWLNLAIASGAAARVSALPEARRLIHEREHQLKGSRARLVNRQALALWQGDSGSAQIDYRWPVTQDIVNDILKGLKRDA
jgi:Family of unknown function (DUF6361)